MVYVLLLNINLFFRCLHIHMVSNYYIDKYWSHKNDAIAFSNLVQICGYDPDQDACQGDSGGPMTVLKTIGNYNRYHIIGVVSYGNPNCGHNQ